MQQKNVLSQVSYNNYDRFTYIKIFEFNTQAIAKKIMRGLRLKNELAPSTWCKTYHLKELPYLSKG